jgi:hypothetical protein
MVHIGTQIEDNPLVIRYIMINRINEKEKIWKLSKLNFTKYLLDLLAPKVIVKEIGLDLDEVKNLKIHNGISRKWMFNFLF